MTLKHEAELDLSQRVTRVEVALIGLEKAANELGKTILKRIDERDMYWGRQCDARHGREVQQRASRLSKFGAVVAVLGLVLSTVVATRSCATITQARASAAGMIK